MVMGCREIENNGHNMHPCSYDAGVFFVICSTICEKSKNRFKISFDYHYIIPILSSIFGKVSLVNANQDLFSRMKMEAAFPLSSEITIAQRI